jgi:hypothetical protein
VDCLGSQPILFSSFNLGVRHSHYTTPTAGLQCFQNLTSNSHYGSSLLCDGQRSRLAAKPSPLRLGQEISGER